MIDYLQGNYHRRSLSPYQEVPQNRNRICPIALAVASLIVLTVVLTVAGLALYMGALHSEFPNPLVTFSCSIKVLRGDRFVGALLQEKTRSYSMQLESLYKRSVLGPSIVECRVDRFGEDTYTIFFRLTLDRKRLPRSASPIETLIRDAITDDSHTPVFAAGSLRIQEVNLAVPYTTRPTLHNNKTRKKGGVLLKSPVMKNISLAIGINPKKKSPVETKKSSSPQGSFRITKTDADITEKHDVKTIGPKVQGSKITSKRTTPINLNRIAATEETKSIEEIGTSTTETSRITTKAYSFQSSTTFSSIFTKLSIPTKRSEIVASFPFITDIIDKEPWTPLFINETKNQEPVPKSNNIKSDININHALEHPVYTSFTNPSLTISLKENSPLGVPNLRGHPIPVNKIVDITESNIVPAINFQGVSLNISSPEIQTLNYDVKHEGQSSLMDDTGSPISNYMIPKREEKIKNISMIFHDLVPSIGNHDVSRPPSVPEIGTYHHTADDAEGDGFGQGQVEVVEDDEETLMKATTKIPLVTLLPVKSNSAVGKPLRRRPYRQNHAENDRRNFGDVIPLGDIDIHSDATGKMAKNPLEDFKIVGMLKFEPKIDDDSTAEYVRRAKMENSTRQLHAQDQFESKFITNSFNFPGSDLPQSNTLTPESLKLLSEISKIYNMNDSQITQDAVISTKAVKPIHGVNNFGFKILSKYLNKVLIDEKSDLSLKNHSIQNCSKDNLICGDGKCLRRSARCNHLKECSDGLDEKNCTCADYLQAQYLNKKVCDGIIDCWDFSDENNCAWCHPGQHICSNTKACVDKNKICDGIKDCLEGDDERQCVRIGKNVTDADKAIYHNEGYLMVRKFGKWGKLCVDNLKNISANETLISAYIQNLGKQICTDLSYRNMSSVGITIEESDNSQDKYYELIHLMNIAKKDNDSSWSFAGSTCNQKNILKVGCQSLECGFRPKIVRYRARIVGGKNAGMGSWPWQASLYKEGEFQCGGSLISGKWLVSAGHCFYKSQEEYWVARLGALRKNTALPSPYEQINPVQKIFIHPGYENNGFVNDIALLKLENFVTFSDYVRPVCLPKVGESLEDDVQCSILGWGQLSEVGRIFPDTLQEVQVPVISTEECRKRTIFLPLYNITEKMFCAGYDRGGRDACLGDSGGPLICPEENGRWVIHGITSNGYGCARANRPGVYTKVSSYVNWIQGYLNLEDSNPPLEIIERKDNKCSGYRCPLGQCLLRSQVCNGYTECNDGSDEVNC